MTGGYGAGAVGIPFTPIRLHLIDDISKKARIGVPEGAYVGPGIQEKLVSEKLSEGSRLGAMFTGVIILPHFRRRSCGRHQS